MSSGKHKQTRRTEAEKAIHRRHTAQNKIRRIEKSLKTAGGQAVAKLEERLNHWRSSR
jgi:hypothetical protein